MNGSGFGRKTLQETLKTEFLISEEMLEARGIELAEASLEIYESVEDFLNRTGWGRDNPECSSEEYLIKMRICCWVDGKFLYFSRIVWEDDKEGESTDEKGKKNGVGNAGSVRMFFYSYIGKEFVDAEKRGT